MSSLSRSSQVAVRPTCLGSSFTTSFARVAMVGMIASASMAACAPSPTYNWPAESALGYKIGPGDVLKINVWKHDELSQQVTVRPDGAFSLPLIGDVSANGRTSTEITNDIQSKLKQFFQEQPPATVQVAEVHSYRIYVVGEVQRGGEFTPAGEVTVLHGLALAGGFTRFANPGRIVIVRRDARGERRIPFDFSAVVGKGELRQNLALQTGDTVIVP